MCRKKEYIYRKNGIGEYTENKIDQITKIWYAYVGFDCN